MPIINPDTSEIEKQGPIAPGTYKAKIKDVEFKTSKASGNPMIVPTFEVQVGDDVRPRNAYMVINGKGAYAFDQLLRATGFTEIADKLNDPTVSPKPEFDTDLLVGQELNVVIESDTYNGELRDKIKSYLKA